MKKYLTIIVLTAVISFSGHAVAKTKIYKSNTNLPFVEMMLSMMVAMGILDKIPPELIGLGGYGASPWGVQRRGYPNLGYSSMGRQYLGKRYRGGANPYAHGGNLPPLYRNNQWGYPGTSPYTNYRYGNRYSGTSWQPLRPSSCVGGSCLSQQSLNGLWVGQDGEMLGVRNDQFLWTDGRDQHMSGLMNVSEDHVVANIDGSDRQISYDYRVQGDELLTKDAGGMIRHYWRYRAGPVLY